MKKSLTTLLILLAILVITGIILNKNKTSAIEVPEQIKTDESIKQTEPVVSILPKTIHPGDPILITINSTSSPKEIIFDDKSLPIFTYNNKFSAFIGIDFNEKIIEHEVLVKFSNGSITKQKIILTPREKIERPLGIPEKLGGNTPQAEKTLLANLAKENVILNTVQTATATLWTTAFTNPLATIFITDDYGYDRKTVNSTIVHKGTDFRAPEGTPVFVMNDGVVRVAKNFIVYGNAVIIDHGLGVQTLYMHLSKLNVKEGDKVKAGQTIGLSGKTGYAESPHLHISVKIGKISIDPMTFLAFFK